MGKGPINGPELEEQRKAACDICPASTFLCLDSEHQNFWSSHKKNEKADFGHGLGDGGGKRGKRTGHAKVSKQERQLFGPATGRALAAMLSVRQPATFWEDKVSFKL